MYDRILIPVDFSEGNRRSIEQAARLGNETTLVTLIHIIEEMNHLNDEEDRLFFERLEAHAHGKMDELTRFTRELGLNYKSEVVPGKRVPSILKYARNHKTSLIILNSSRLDMEQPVQGFSSISHAVAVFSQCPVFLLK